MSARPLLSLAARFDLQLLERPLRFWLSEAGVPSELLFAVPGPLEGALRQAWPGCGTGSVAAHLLLAHADDPALLDANSHLPGSVTGFAAAIDDHGKQCTAPVLLTLCPALAAQDDRLVAAWQARAAASGGRMVVITPSVLTAGFSAPLSDPRLTAQTGIPFRPEFFEHLAAPLARAVHALLTPPAKVLVLDADGTLWDGVVGEDGAEQVTVSARACAIHEFALEQRKRGVLLALASKNAEGDLRSVFARADVPLDWSDFAATRANWDHKSDSIASLASELRLGIDTFVLLDDSGVECAQVRSLHPEVACITVPPSCADTEHLLEHLWAFDGARTVQGAAARRDFYQRAPERERVRNQAGSVREFLASLDLRVSIAPARDTDADRIAELSIRTNQFNTQRSRTSEAEVRAALACEAAIHVVHVADRFGDYGLVGVVSWRDTGGTLTVEQFLLSCRALGRGVEHAMFRHLAQHAAAAKAVAIDLPYVESLRSEPARRFLESLPHTLTRNSAAEATYRVATTAALEVEASDATLSIAASPTSADQPLATAGAAHRARGLERIAMTLSRPGESRSAMRGPRRPRPLLASSCTSPATALEVSVTAIWKEVLHLEDVGIDDSFADLGGKSLQLLEVFAALSAAGHRDLTVVDLFRVTTIRSLAAHLANQPLSAVETRPLSVRAMRQQDALAALAARARRTPQ